MRRRSRLIAGVREMTIDFDELDQNLEKVFGALGRLVLLGICVAALFMFVLMFTFGWFDALESWSATLWLSWRMALLFGLATLSMNGALTGRLRVRWLVWPAVVMAALLVVPRLVA